MLSQQSLKCVEGRPSNRSDDDRFKGYGWPATLELLSPLENTTNSRQFKMTICPSCRSVHEIGGRCISTRNQDSISHIIGNLANLTLAEAWTWIDQLTRDNDTGNVTSFPFVVTDKMYTMGFDPMLLNVLPNMTVENSGNSSLPPPPIREPSWWEAVWNTFTGIVSAIWDAVVAVMTFIANVIVAVVKWFIGLAKAIASGEGLQYIYDTVVKPFVDAVLAFIQWIIDWITAVLVAFVDGVLKPALDGVVAAVERVMTAMSVALQLAGDVAGAIGEAMIGALPVLLLVSSIVVLIIAGVG